LTQENYVETYLKESSFGPPRKYYRMTDHGQQVTKQLVKDWDAFSQKINQLIELEVTHE
jgi:PadR family transcriptional regulator, regulatory protein PadR